MRLSSFLLALFILSTSGCSWFKDAIDETSDWSANQLYSEAKEKLTEKNYEKARIPDADKSNQGARALRFRRRTGCG